MSLPSPAAASAASRLRLERVRVRIIFPSAADGSAIGEKDLTERLLGIGGGNALPLLCTSHRLDFAAISRTAEGRPSDYFFKEERARSAPSLPSPDFQTTVVQQESVAAYNFFNMLVMLLPGVEPGAGRKAQFASLPAAAPERASYTAAALRAARLHPSAPAANTATPGAGVRGGGGGDARRWAALRLRRDSLQRARALASPPPPSAFSTTQGGASAAAAAAAETIDASTYTVFRSTWLNDAVNHPVYATLIRSILEYQQWRDDQEKQIKAKTLDYQPARTRFLSNLTTDLPFQTGGGVKNAAEETFATALKNINTQTTRQRAAASSSPPEENAETTRLRAAIDELNKTYAVIRTPPPPSTDDAARRAYDMNRETAIHNFLQQMDIVRVSQRTVEGTRSSGSEDTLASARQALSGLAPLLAAYQAVELEDLANQAIATMDVQYDLTAAPQEDTTKNNRAPRLTAKYMEEMHPQFVQLVGALRTFHNTYTPSNPHWRDLIRIIVTDKPRAKGTFLALMYACKEMTEGHIITARKPETMKDAASGKDLLPVGLDLVVLSNNKSSAAAAAAAPPSGGASALSPLREAYVQCDVIGFAYESSDLGPAVCAFRDFYLGAETKRVMYPPQTTQWVGQIPPPLFMPPPPTKNSNATAATTAKGEKSRG